MNQVDTITLVKALEADLEEVHALCQRVAACTPSSGWSSDYPSRELLANDISTQSLYKVLGKNYLCYADSPLVGIYERGRSGRY